MSVLSNAVDAIQERSQSASEDVDVLEGRITIHTAVLDGEQVQLSIMDNGVGMDDEALHQVFNPFFTTKPVGQGTGMGMSISHQTITKQHQGTLECDSTLGVGTKFVICLPIHHVPES